MDSLILACLKNDLTSVKRIIEENNNINVNIRDIEYDSTLLIHATIKDNNEIVKYLLTLDNLDLNAQDREGMNALMYACQNNNLIIVRMLLSFANVKKGKLIDINAKNNMGETVLDIVTKNKDNKSIFNLLSSYKFISRM